MKLQGTEALTLEVGATLDEAAARALVPERFDVDGRASVLLFEMSGLVMRAMPFPAFDYREALWRVSIRHEGALAWFAVKCDIDHPIVRALGARVVRYPTREARIVGSEGRWSVDAKGTKLELRVHDEDKGEVPVLRRTFVGGAPRVFEIPWDEVPPAKARRVRVTASDDALLRATFGESAKLDGEGVVHRGRIHMCSSARRI
jgi:hypothetical protein